jgi:hypothetical protein
MRFNNGPSLMPLQNRYRHPFVRTEDIPQQSLAKEMRLVQPLSYIDSRKGLKSTSKRIGLLTIEERKRKIQRYRDKRSKRVWAKRINYNCRKRVADKRNRFKGRFVSKYDTPETLNELVKQSIKQETNLIIQMPRLEKVKKIFNIIHDS